MDHRRKKTWRKPAVPMFDWRKFEPSMYEVGDGQPSLAEELTTYRDRLPELLEHEGEYVVIKGREYRILPDRESALAYSLDHYWPEPALVKKIAAKEPIITLGGAVL